MKQLSKPQEPSGVWGRFHNQDTNTRKPFRTSEAAIQQALALGLDRNNAILRWAVTYMEKTLKGEELWSDQVEKHEGWAVNTRFITAGTLARVDPLHAMLATYQAVWAEILKRTFSSGRYDPEAERDSHLALNGIITRGKYLHLGMVYPHF